MEQQSSVYAERSGRVGTIVLNQPRRRNALSLEMWERIPGLVEELTADRSIRAIVVRGAGRDAFSAGADITEFEEKRSTPEKAIAYSERTHRAFDALAGCRKPTIAMIYGFCFGGGFELALCADVRVAGESAQFGITPARLGISLGWSDLRNLLWLAGPANAKEILLTAGRFSATRIREMGLVNVVVPDDDVEGEVIRLADEVSEVSPASIRWLKEAIEIVMRDPGITTVPNPSEKAAGLFGGPDFQEGVRSFLEKRKPNFTGE
ncbi:MAG TPA: enoyl-CoA hydratase-related protein [Chloroflexota bacterium]|jgi:enoyl-CoA hydratase/carnithine racemase|nr:enoyl-CoA hydratase-related protein [Chloroflexota bacterium]